MKVICFNHVGNRYINEGAKGYILYTVGDPTKIFGLVRTKSGRFIEKWLNTTELYNFRLKHPEDNLRALAYEDDQASSILRRFGGDNFNKD
jgi:hypothetical protein